MLSIVSIERTSKGSWIFIWVGTGPFEIWLDGILIEETSELEYEFLQSGYPVFPPPLEIVEADSESEDNPPFLIIQWRGNQYASAYLVEQYVDGEWVERKFLTEVKAGYYQVQTGPLADQELSQWRVRAVDAYGNYGPPLELSKEITRNPPQPSVIIDFASGKVTVEDGL